MSVIKLYPVRTMSFLYGAVIHARNFLFGIAVLSFCATGAAYAQTVTIAALGDSLTQGYGLPAEEGLVSQLQAQLNAENSDITLINAGVSGDTTAGGLSRLDWTLTPDVDALIVALGGNDLMRGIDPNETRANLRQILSQTQERGLPILLVGLKGASNFGPEFKTDFDAIYPELAQEFGVLLYPDIFSAFRHDLSDTAALRKYMQGDAIHPNAVGVAAIVDDLAPHVAELASRVRNGQ